MGSVRGRRSGALRTLVALLPWLVASGVVVATLSRSVAAQPPPFQTLEPSPPPPVRPEPKTPSVVTFEPWEQVPS
jgi:hypothetical protein